MMVLLASFKSVIARFYSTRNSRGQVIMDYSSARALRRRKRKNVAGEVCLLNGVEMERLAELFEAEISRQVEVTRLQPTQCLSLLV